MNDFADLSEKQLRRELEIVVWKNGGKMPFFIFVRFSVLTFVVLLFFGSVIYFAL